MFISLMSYDCLYIKDIDMTYKYKYNLQKSFKYKYNLSNTNTSFTDSHYTLHLIISKSFKTIFHYWNIIIIHLCWKILYFKVYIDKYTKYRDSIQYNTIQKYFIDRNIYHTSFTLEDWIPGVGLFALIISTLM